MTWSDGIEWRQARTIIHDEASSYDAVFLEVSIYSSDATRATSSATARLACSVENRFRKQVDALVIHTLQEIADRRGSLRRQCVDRGLWFSLGADGISLLSNRNAFLGETLVKELGAGECWFGQGTFDCKGATARNTASQMYDIGVGRCIDIALIAGASAACAHLIMKGHAW